MKRRTLLISIGTALLGTSLNARAETPSITFEEMYASSSVLGLAFSDTLKKLAGQKIRIRGFMAPPLKAEADFLVLTKEPVSLCPFCSSDQDWPNDIILVRLARRKDFVQSNTLIEVSGQLQIGSETDEKTGFVSLVRIVDADYRIV